MNKHILQDDYQKHTETRLNNGYDNGADCFKGFILIGIIYLTYRCIFS